MRKKLFTLLLAIVASIGSLFAERVQIGDLWYDAYPSLQIASVSYTTKSNNIYNSGCSATEVNIPENIDYNGISCKVISIGDYAFLNYTQLTHITLPNSITNIGQYAFSNTKIETISLPDSVTRIDGFAFSSCRKLKSITIPDNVTSLGNYIFSSATLLEDIYIGKKVKTIGNCAFSGCSNLTTIVWNAINCNNFSENSTPFYYYSTSYQYDLRTQITSFVIGEAVEYLPSYLCYGMNNIEEKVLPCHIHCRAHAIENSNFSQPDASYTELPDTTICAGEMICKGEKNCTYSYSYYDSFDDNPGYEWNREDYEAGKNAPYCYNCGEYEISETYHEFIEWVNSHKKYDVKDATICPDGMNCQENCPDCQRYYSNTELSLTYTNSKGCDSIVARKIIISKVKLPKILSISAIETPQTGAIQIYDNNDGEWASYGYFRLNGKLISHASGKDEAPYVISNLLPGVYKLVFYTNLGCDSVSVSCEIIGKHMIIGNLYYNFINEDEEVWNSTLHRNETIHHHYAEVTYRGTKYDDYDEYSGNIIIPDSVYYNGEYWPVKLIGEDAFRKSSVESVVIPTSVETIEKNVFYKCEKLKYLRIENSACKLKFDNFYVSAKSSYDASYDYTCIGLLYWQYFAAHTASTRNYYYTTIPIYVPYGSLSYYKTEYSAANTTSGINFRVVKQNSITSEVDATSATITLGVEDEVAHIASCGIAEGESTVGNVLQYIGLEPNSTYLDVPLFVKTIEGDSDVLSCSFSTTALTLTTKASKPVSSTTAILLAETNMSDAEVSCGFEYKRNDAPADMAGTKVFCPVASGQMAGRLKNLKDDVYYKYRAFYQSSAGNMYYGDWQYIFTGDVAVEFDPILYTYGATVVKENEATISGYALAGSEDFTEQGFEYWAESRVDVQGDNVQGTKVAPHRMPAALNEHFFVQTSGIALHATLTDLDAGTVYKYRVYGKAGDQYYYGSEQSFTTKGEYKGDDTEAIEDVQIDNTQNTKAQKFLHNGQIYILRGEKVYTVTGQEVK